MHYAVIINGQVRAVFACVYHARDAVHAAQPLRARYELTARPVTHATWVDWFIRG